MKARFIIVGSATRTVTANNVTSAASLVLAAAAGIAPFVLMMTMLRSIMAAAAGTGTTANAVAAAVIAATGTIVDATGDTQREPANEGGKSALRIRESAIQLAQTTTPAPDAGRKRAAGRAKSMDMTPGRSSSVAVR